MSGRELMVGGRPLSSLRVVDLKEELDKRGLSKSGSKKDLAERLKVHLQIEKHREGASRDEEQLPNISMQEKLAEQNPFIRDYFASQAELYHSQKVVKKLYEEETRKESEASGASADEGCDSPVKEKKIVSSSERSKVRKLVQQFETQSKEKDEELQRSSKISKNDEKVKPQEVISEETSKVDVGHSERRLTRGRSTEGLRSRESRRVSGDKSPVKDSKLSSTKTIVNDSKQLSKDMKLCEVETSSVDIPTTGKDILVPKEKLGDVEMKEHENVSNVVLDLSVGDGSKEIPKSSILTRQSRSSEKSLVKESIVLQPEAQELPKKMVGKIEVTKEPVKTPNVTITENPQNLDLSFTKGEEKDSIDKSSPVKVVANEISSKSNAKQETQASISQPAQLDTSPPKKQIREIVYATKSVVRPVEPEKYETRKTDNQVAPKSVNVAIIQPMQHNSPDKEVKLARQRSPDKTVSVVKQREEKDENDKTELEIHANVTEIDIDLNISSKETKLPDPDTRLTRASAAEATQSQSVIKTRETSDKSPGKDRKFSKITVTKESLVQLEDKNLGSLESSKKQLNVIDANPRAVKLNMEGLRSEENVKLGKTEHSIVDPAAKEQVKSSEIKPGLKSSEKSPEKEVKLPTEIEPVNKSSPLSKKTINWGSEDVDIQKDPKQGSKDVQKEKSLGKGDVDFSKGAEQPLGKGEQKSTSYKEKESPSSKGKESPSRKEKESPSHIEKESPTRKEKESTSHKEKESHSRKEKESPSRKEKESPSRKEKESPSRKDKESPSRKEKESPSRKEKESTSHKEKEPISRREKEATSQREKEATSRKEKELTPQKEKEATPQKEKEATPQKEKEATPQKEKEATPQKEKEATPQKEKETTPRKEKEETPQKEKEATSLKEKEAISQKEKESTSQKEKETISQKDKESTSQREKETISQKEKESTSQKAATSHKEKESISRKEKESTSHRQKELISYKEKTPTREAKETISHQEKTTAREEKEASSERKMSTHTKSPIIVKRKHSITIEESVLRVDDKDENDKAELELHVNTAEIIDVEEPKVTIRSSRISTNKMEINNSSSKLAERSRRFQLSRDKFQPQKKQKRSDSSSSSESRSPSMVTTTRLVSVRTEEMDDEALDYGDEEKSKSEPEKFNWSGRILRLKNKQMIRSKERKWRKDTTRKTVVFMDNEYYQALYADVKPVAVNELKLDDKSPPRVERKIEIIRKISLDTEEKEFIPTPAIVEDKPITRKVSIVPIVDDSEKELTPSRNPPSQFIIVTNLVRPFTLPQLKDLLQRTGNIVDIWVDKIKSTCIAKFETEEEALETRSALHGVQWPATNSKPLHVDYSTEESFEDYKAKDAGESKPNVEKPKLAQTHPVREWDLGKRSRSRSPSRIRRRSRSTSRDRKRVRPSHSPHKRRHSRTPTQDRKGRGADVKDAEPTGKALDELFRKTAATPSIYWLPLTPQQIAEKEDLRRRRMQERERRLAELSKLRPR